MAAPDSTKFQINYKLSDGTLINLYATTVTELETGLADLGMVATLIKTTGVDLGATAAKPAPSAVDTIAQAFPGATVVQQPSPVQESSAGQNCKHGPMTYREGTNARGAWRAYMCPSPKGAPDKCDSIFLK